jgi:hypothetical protein
LIRHRVQRLVGQMTRMCCVNLLTALGTYNLSHDKETYVYFLYE